MSMAGGNAAMTLDFVVSTAQLGPGLAQAEAQVTQSANKMAYQTDALMKKWTSGLQGMVAGALGPMAAISAADKFARSFADAITKNRSIPRALEGAFLDMVSNVPLVGALGAFRGMQTLPQRSGGGGLFETLYNLIARREIPFPEELGGGVFRFGQGAGLFPSNDPEFRAAQLQARIQRLQSQLTVNQPRTFEDLMAEELGKVSKGAMGEVSTALGTFRFAQESASAQAELVAAARTQVDLIMRIEKAMQELKGLVGTSN